MPDELTRERCTELEGLMSDPDAEPTVEQLLEWKAYCDASMPRGEHFMIEEGEEWPPEALEQDARMDAWYQRPITESLFGPVQARLPRAHVPPVALSARPLRIPRTARQTRSSRRVVRGRVQAAHGPPREPSDEPPPDLVALRVISPEEFHRAVDRWLGGGA